MQESFLNPPDYVLNSFIWIWIARSKKFQFENRKIRPCAWPLNKGPKSKLFRKLTSWYFVIRTDFWFWIFSDLWIKKNFRKTNREEKNPKTKKQNIEKIQFLPKISNFKKNFFQKNIFFRNKFFDFFPRGWFFWNFFLFTNH